MPGMAASTRRHLRVGLRAKGRRRAGEQLGVGFDLGVHLKPHDDFPIARGAVDDVGVIAAHGGLLYPN
jgi:hypothetical protein